MALFKSQVLTQASGSVGGLTYTRASGGMVMRARAVPVQPNSANQLAVKAALTTLVTQWTETLTAAQRAAWDLYALNTPTINKLGDTVNLSGQNWFIAANTPRLQALSKLALGISQILDAPTIFNRGTFETPTIAPDEVTGITITFNPADAWNNEDDAVMLIYQGRPENAARNFFKGPYRLIGSINGDSAVPPTSPKVIAPATLATLGFVIAEGQKSWVAFAVSRADGRLSTRQVVGPVLVTP